MSVEFRITVKLVDGNDDVLIKSDLDLNGRRALRIICPKNAGGYIDDSGSVEISSQRAIQWLGEVVGNCASPEICAALQYIMYLQSTLDQLGGHELRVEVRWA